MATKKHLVICESPAKIKPIGKYLGPDFIVKSCVGHFRDLDRSNLSVDLGNNFKPTFSISPGKENIVRELKREMKKCDNVYIASDFDREGESIGWHLKEVLKIPDNRAKRIIFTEITKTALTEAVRNPTTIDMNMVNSQQGRRIADRIIGYLISPELWKEIQSSYKEKKSLSAGRVQSPCVKLVIEREEAIEKFESKPFYRVSGRFKLDIKENIILNAELNKDFSLPR